MSSSVTVGKTAGGVVSIGVWAQASTHSVEANRRKNAVTDTRDRYPITDVRELPSCEVFSFKPPSSGIGLRASATSIRM
jgi:hypothetical protein